MSERIDWRELQPYHYRIFLVSLVAYSFAQLDLALFGYAIPSIREEFGLTLSQIMLVVSAAFLIASVLIVRLGVMADRIGRRKTFQFSFVVSSLLVAAHSLVPNPLTLTLLRGTSIAVGGLTYPITAALITEEFPARFRGLFTGFLQCGYAMGWFLASLFAASVMVNFGWRALFLIGLVSIPFIWVIRRYIQEPRRFTESRQQLDAVHKKPGVRDLFSPTYRKLTLTLFSAQLLFVWAYAGSVFLFPSFFREARGLELASSSLLIGMGNGISIFGYILAAFVGEFLLTRRTTVVIWTLMGSLFFQLLVWGPHHYYLSIALYGAMGFFFYGTAAVKLAFVAEIFPTRLRATGIVFCGSLAVTLGSALGPLAVARIVETAGWNIAFSLVVGIPLALAGLLYLLITPIKSGLEVEQIEHLVAQRAADSQSNN